MKDLLYIAGTILFFALMVAYVAACARLGRKQTEEEAANDAR